MDWSPTADWLPLRDKYFRKVEIYKTKWNLNLAKFRAVGAQFGGPVAMVRDSSKPIAVGPGELAVAMRIYNRAGDLLGSIPWDRMPRLVTFGWSSDEALVCVLETGEVQVYDVLGQRLELFGLGPDVKQEGVLDAIVWEKGIIVLTKAYSLFMTSGFNQPRIMRMADTLMGDPPTSWCMIEPRFTATGNVEVLLATKSGTILVVDADQCSDQRLSNGPFTKMTMSPDGRFLACFTVDGDLWVTTADFKRAVMTVKTESKVPPRQLVWCGVNTVVMYFAPLLLAVGLSKELLKFQYDVALLLTGEIDGLCITSNASCEILQMVPTITTQIFGIGSTEPPARLYDAADMFHRKEPRAYDFIRSIRDEGQLVTAVNDCLRAGAREFNVQTQKALLRAVSFGKCFDPSYDCTEFVDTCRAMRIINAVRHESVGIAITFEQYLTLGVQALIDRLISRHQHHLATKLCEYVNVSTDRVLIHWACAKVKARGDPGEILATIVDKLGPVAGVSYVQIASTAYTHGAVELATRLLDYEPRAADQVPLLIRMKKEERALAKAIACGDTDLVYLVLLHMRRTMTPEQFMAIIHNQPQAFELMIKYCKTQDVGFLQSLYHESGRLGECGHVAVSEAYVAPNVGERLKRLGVATRLYDKDRAYAFYASMAKEQMDLTRYQVDLESAYPSESFVDLSLHDTVSKLIYLGQEKRASKAASTFKISSKRFGAIKVQALALARRWEALDEYSRERKCPAPLATFVSACIEEGSKGEALKYIKRLKDPAEQASFLILIQRFRDAADCAAQAKDLDLLLLIRGSCTDDDRGYVEKVMSQFQ